MGLVDQPRASEKRRARTGRQAGFTLTEMMVTLVIIGVLATLSAPLLGSRDEDKMRAFTNSLARDLQRARMQAVSERLPVTAYAFVDRFEFRQATDGATPGAAPVEPVVTDAPLRVLAAPRGVEIMDVVASAAVPGSATLGTAPPAEEIRFFGMGSADLLNDSNDETPIQIWIQNTELPAAHPYRTARITVSPLTGHVVLREEM